MKVFTSADEMREESAAAKRDGRTVGFVATMGALHEGHLSLIDAASALADFIAVSIFVNPTQFGPGEDLDQYPRDLDGDLEHCRERAVDAVFAPSAETMYGAGEHVFVSEDAMSTVLCGGTRQGHFRGVLTVVAKLFNIVQPDVTVFGQKDAQQARLIERMIEELAFPIALHLAPIVREPDGLAMSSRNRYLDEAAREQALCLHEALQKARRAYEAGERRPDAVRRDIESTCHEHRPLVDVEYIECVDFSNLARVETLGPGTLIALAVHVDGTRLIDNIIL